MVEFFYSNSYQSSMKMASFNFLYGRPHRAPISWDWLEDQILIGLEVVQNMEEQMTIMKERLKEAQIWKKSYVDAHWNNKCYEVEDMVFFIVRPQKSSIIFGKGARLPPWFLGPFEAIEKKCSVAYRIVLPTSLAHMHNVFHIFLLCHYISNPLHVIDMRWL